mgnify:CR=1 FL=1
MHMFSFYHFVRNPRESTRNVAALQQQVRALTAQVEEEKALRRREIEKEKALRQRMQRELENLTKIVTQLNKKAKDGIA